MTRLLDFVSYYLQHPRDWLERVVAGKPLVVRHVFSVDAVSIQGPQGNVQNYLDRRSIRRYLSVIASTHTLERALEVGCGYGRLTMVLGEFAEEVVGIEREPELAGLAKTLLPTHAFIQQDSILSFASLSDDSFDFVMTFTVLQHMVDEDCERVISEIRRVCRPTGHVLLAEKYFPGDETPLTSDRTRFLSKHRPVSVYAELMRPFELVEARPRPVQPLWKANPCGLMLFKGPASSVEFSVLAV